MVIAHRLLIAILAMALVACSERNQVGASASSERSVSTSQSSGYKQSESLTVSRDLSSSVSIPAAPVIFDALRIDMATAPAAEPSTLELLVRYNLAGKARAQALTPDESAAWEAIHHRDALRVRALVTEAVRPLFAWPVAPFDTASGRPYADALSWSAERYAAAELANAVATEIAVAMAGQVIRTPAEARAKARDAFERLDHAALLIDYDARRQTTRVRTMDGQTVHYVLDNGADVKVDASGPTLALNGAPWFGNGTLSGKTYKFAMSRSVGDSSAETVDSSRERTGSASQRTDSTASTK